jgi:phosphate-selective porin OprO and OprP
MSEYVPSLEGRKRVVGLALCLALTVPSPLVVAAQAPTTAASQPMVDVGLGRGVTIRSADDEVSLNLRARIQVRSTIIDAGQDEQPLSEISIRRARLVVQGNALGPELTYYIQLSFSNLDNEADLRLPLRDAYVTWVPSRHVSVRLGQMKVPFSRQRVTSSSALQMVDRSIVVSEWNLDRDVGVQLFSRSLLNDKLGYTLGLFGGEGRNRLGRAAGFLYSARVESWPFGQFDDVPEGDLQRRHNLRLAVGASVGYNQDTNRPRSTIGTPFTAGDFDYTHAGVDMTLKWRGWSVLSEWLYRSADRDTEIVPINGVAATIVSRSGWGAYLQSGWMFSSRWEVSGRYSHLAPSPGTDVTFIVGDELGGGLSYYMRDHNLKIQGDYSAVTDQTSARRVHQVRAQFQLFF